MSDGAFSVGTATARRGEIVYGALPVLDLPTGGQEQLPVIIARGDDPDGPTFWLTANIHGGEVTGIPVIHRLLRDDLPARLHGTLVAIPSLNLAGLRTAQRAPYYATDPNRLWPEHRPNGEDDATSIGVYERIAARVFAAIARRGDYLLDLHNAAIRTIPFTIVDRVLYRGERDRPRAEQLGARLLGLARACGLSTVNEAAPAKYVRQTLHRSVSGSLVNVLGIPALTLELGLTGAVEPAMVEVGSTAVRNALRWAGMLPGEPEPVTTCLVVDAGYPTKRDDSARASRSGLLVPLLEPGARFSAGQRLAEMVDLWGRPIPESAIVAPDDGWLIGWHNGLARYAGQVVGSLALRDDAPLVAPHPER